jgi:predicted phosphodiesterase
MKIAVLADIHANYPALRAVAEHIQDWGPDRVIVAGDIVNRGPRPVECWEFVQRKENEQGWILLRGNHEDYVCVHSKPDAPQVGPLADLYQYSYWTYQKLGDTASLLEALPTQYSWSDPQAGELRGVHASMRSNRHGIYPEMADATLKRLIKPAPALLAVGHTHRPMIRQVEDTLIVNSGSVGLPFDGDPLANYAQISFSNAHWQAKIIQVPYDIQRAKDDFTETGFLDEAGPLAKLIHLELEYSLSQLYQWMSIYMNAVLAEEITVEQGVAEYLIAPNITPYW